MNQRLIEKMNKHIEEYGIKKTFLAKKFGISSGHFGNWLHGRYPISKEVEDRIKAYLKEKD